MIRQAVAGVSAGRVVARALAHPEAGPRLTAGPADVIAVGKAAPAMAVALLGAPGMHVRTALAIGSHPSGGMPPALDFMQGSHPFPDARSQDGARAALDRARAVSADGHLVLLVSGGASALMAEAAEGLSFEDKLAATRGLMLAGADIHQLNALRKHLSRVKGGWLAAACPGATTTLALSDVIGDDLSVIGSGPGWPDSSSWLDVSRAVDACRAWDHMPAAVRARIEEGRAGRLADTPKPGDPRLARTAGFVVGRASDAVSAAAEAAASLGYHVETVEAPVTGEARTAALPWLEAGLARARSAGHSRVCVLSAGETTVTVRGTGAGGRNLEFVLSLVERLADEPQATVASAGTDGIDGLTDVAGAWADASTLARAVARGLPAPADVLARNDSFNYFRPLGDTVRLGRTDTNVGDLQVLLLNQ